MARAGMATMIEQVRLLANVGTAEWTIGTVSYWTDNQVQAQLDAHRRDFMEDVSPQGVNVTGTVEYHDYRLSYGNLEDIGSGTAAWSVRDTGGTLYGTADYSAAYDVGLISFTADTAGSPMVVRYRAYDPYSAAADIWRSRAANVSLYYDIKEGEHSLSRSQMFSHCMLQATILDNMAGAGVNQMTRMYRSDFN